MTKTIREWTDANGCRWKEVQGHYGTCLVHLGKAVV